MTVYIRLSSCYFIDFVSFFSLSNWFISLQIIKKKKKFLILLIRALFWKDTRKNEAIIFNKFHVITSFKISKISQTY